MRNRSQALTPEDIATLDFAKGEGLIPAIVQHATTLQVLMLGYMSRESLHATFASREVTFYSRSKGRLWRKGETSGNVLELREIRADCDGDALLITAAPKGPTCHLGLTGCFADGDAPGLGFLARLEETIRARRGAPPEKSYTARLYSEGIARMAQKVGEEGVEVALAGAAGNRDQLKEEAADLLYHLAVLLAAHDLSLGDAAETLRARAR